MQFEAKSNSRPVGLLPETVLLLSLVLVGVMFVLTGALARMYHAKEESLAQEWYSRGDAHLASGEAANALEDFRNALNYSPGNPRAELRLAESLEAAGRFEEARVYFLHLLEQTPGSGEVNLDLARLESRDHHTDAAIRYYRDAIFGVWAEDPLGQRITTRIELVQYLSSLNLNGDAQAALVALAASVPPTDPALNVRVGSMLLAAKNYSPALAKFRQALAVDPNNAAALNGAVQSEFALGDFRRAEPYLPRALKLNPGDVDLRRISDAIQMVREIDPNERGLPDMERAHRASQDLEVAGVRLASCAQAQHLNLDAKAPSSPLQIATLRLESNRSNWSARNLARHPERIADVMDLVFDIEKLTAKACGAPTGADQAILLLALSPQSEPQ